MKTKSFLPTIVSLAVTALYVAILPMGCSKTDALNDEHTLAVIDDRVIKEEDFVQRFQKINRRLGLVPNGEVRRKILRNFINEELLISEAYNLKLEATSAAQTEYQRIKIQELLNAYYRQTIEKQVSVSEKELKQLYINLNTTLTARHLYAPTKEKADSLYRLLKKGASFERLARENFKDPVLRESGGLIGSFTVDEMDPAFEEAAYKLEVGETSEPVRTQAGYSIIRLEDRKVKPFLLETEYASHKDKLYRYWKNRKSKQKVRAFVDSLAERLDIQFNESAIEALYNSFRKNNPVNPQLESKQWNWAEGELDENTPLLHSALGEWTLKTFRQAARFTSDKQRRHIRNPDALKSFISGLVVRRKILEEARAMELDKTDEYAKNVRFEFDTYLLQKMEEEIFASIEVPKDTLLAYYKENTDRFMDPARIRIREIVLKDDREAEIIGKKLRQGENFSELARQYSIRKWSAEKGGEVGYVTPNDLGRWSQTVFALEENQWTGPLKVGEERIFVQCVDKKPARLKPFDLVADDVEQAVKTMWWERERNKKIKEIETRVPVVAYWEKLNDIRLN